MSTQPDCTAVNAHSVSGSSESTDCGRCHAPDYTEYCPSQPSPPAVGDIWAIQETPGTFVRIATGHENRKSSSTKRKGRPAVFLQPGPRRGRARKGVQGPQQTKCLICLLATFGHEADITKLSQILQFFSLPVYPHQALSAPDCSQTPPHVHTSPEWCEKNAWLIAYSFKSSATIDGRWENPSAQSGSSYRLGEKSLSALLDVCEQKRREWDQFIQQHPDVAKRWFQEYQEDNARIWEERSVRFSSKHRVPSCVGLIYAEPRCRGLVKHLPLADVAMLACGRHPPRYRPPLRSPRVLRYLVGTSYPIHLSAPPPKIPSLLPDQLLGRSR
ncbi:hypothetical protein C2E23DRAFT_546099 [Lenzites betulinus]|nr:hypothetical protein C2E23DRAFT_546099 [Lenzites betulinus]